MLEISHLCVNIGAIEILRSVQMSLPTGTMTGLFGRNGAGKTSLLRTVMGAMSARQGGITLNGQALERLPAHRRAHLGIGYMPEDRKLVPELSCRDNLLVPLHAGVALERRRLDWVVELIPELQALLPRRASLLSGGQQKIVALGRAFVVGRDLLLLDEPTEGVAPVLATRFSDILAQLKGTGTTILVAESDSRYVRHLVDHTYELDRGEATLLAASAPAPAH